jgi:hypothetical protein
MSPRVPDPGTAARIRATAAALATTGLDAKVHSTRGVLDITASLHQPGGRPVEVIVDEDGYAQISYWNALGATPAQMAEVITGVLDHEGIPAYLEAATKRTRRLYARHGYRLCPGAPIQLPRDGPLIWPMWRESYQQPLNQPVLP